MVETGTTAAGPEILPRRFSPWFGLLAAAAAGVSIYLAGERGVFPTGWWETPGRLMTPVHALAVFAIVTLLGERGRIAGWSSALSPYERSGTAPASPPDWVRWAFDRSVGLLRVRPSLEERRAAVAEIGSAMERDLARRWQRPRDLAFVILVVGCVLSLLNLRLVPNAVRWGEIGMSLVLAVAESSVVVLLATWVARDVRSALARWQVVADTLSARRQREGDPDDDLEVDDQGGDSIEVQETLMAPPEREPRFPPADWRERPSAPPRERADDGRPPAPDRERPPEPKRPTTPPSTPATPPPAPAENRTARRRGDEYR
jgi:hypothetical protein